jgi:hypothetical protein
LQIFEKLRIARLVVDWKISFITGQKKESGMLCLSARLKQGTPDP